MSTLNVMSQATTKTIENAEGMTVKDVLYSLGFDPDGKQLLLDKQPVRLDSRIPENACSLVAIKGSSAGC